MILFLKNTILMIFKNTLWLFFKNHNIFIISFPVFFSSVYTVLLLSFIVVRHQKVVLTWVSFFAPIQHSGITDPVQNRVYEIYSEFVKRTIYACLMKHIKNSPCGTYMPV